MSCWTPRLGSGHATSRGVYDATGLPCMIGLTLGHHRILERLGAGGMGEVYLARDERLERDVALKVLRAGALADEGMRRRFRKEALALSKLNHPNIETAGVALAPGMGLNAVVAYGLQGAVGHGAALERLCALHAPRLAIELGELVLDTQDPWFPMCTLRAARPAASAGRCAQISSSRLFADSPPHAPMPRRPAGSSAKRPPTHGRRDSVARGSRQLLQGP